MQIALVLRSGGVYKPLHVQTLAAQISANLPECHRILCLTDVDVPGVDCVRMSYMWPGWWSKLELFRPDIRGDILYFDLDTVVRGLLHDLLQIKQRAMLQDFYRPHGLGSGVMVLPESERAFIWEKWIANPARAIQLSGLKGDQHFLERFWLNDNTLRIQDALPDQIVSYKVHCKNGVPPTARVVCAHGKPKLWDVPEFKHLYE